MWDFLFSLISISASGKLEKMESFYSPMVFPFGLHTMLSDQLVDIVGKLPEEIGIMILRMLDSRTLLSAAKVSKTWLNLCHSDSRLQERILQQIMLAGVEQYQNPRPNKYCSVSNMNGHNRMTVVAPVSGKFSLPAPFAK